MIIFLAAMGKNREIGAHNKLLWHIPSEMRLFRQYIRGKIVLVGRKTYQSMGPRPLRRCKHVFVVSQDCQGSLFEEGHTRLQAPADVFNYRDLFAPSGDPRTKGTDLWVLGGSQVYSSFLPQAQELRISYVQKSFTEADSFFPPFSKKEWHLKEESTPLQDPSEIPYIHRIWIRRLETAEPKKEAGKRI